MIRMAFHSAPCLFLSPLLAAIALPRPMQAQKYDPNNLPRLPRAELLVAGYVPERQLLTTEDRTITLPESLSEAFLSISADGSVVGYVRRIPVDRSPYPRNIVGTYSVKDGKCTDRLLMMGNFWGSSAISPDGSRMAYVSRDFDPDPVGLHWSLWLLDFKTGKLKLVTKPSGAVGEITWSPDGLRIAFDMEQPSGPGHWSSSEIRAIYIVDIETGTISRIGIGLSPSWSPSGDWIAFVSYIPVDRAQSQSSDEFEGKFYAINDNRVSLMSPVGTHSRILMGFHSDVVPNLKPVWSPDSKTLLFNKSQDPDNGTFDIDVLDVVTGKIIKKFKNVAPVYAWIEPR